MAAVRVLALNLRDLTAERVDLTRRFGAVAADLLAVLAIFAASVGFFGPALRVGLVYYERDTVVFYYPVLAAVQERLRELQLPLWTSRILAGYPLFADGEVGAFYPPVFFGSLILGPQQLFTALVVGHVVLAGLTMYVFARTLRLSRVPALASAGAYMLAGFTIAQIHHLNIISGLAWAPLVFAFAEQALRAEGLRRLRTAVLAGVAFGLQCLTVHVQVPMMTGFGLAVYVGGRALIEGLRAFAWAGRFPEKVAAAARWAGLAVGILAAVPLVGGMLGAVQLLPLYELGTFSVRSAGLSYELASRHVVAPSHLITLFNPYFFRTPDGFDWSLWSPWETAVYVGVAPLFLAATGLVFGRPRLTLPLTGVALGGLGVAMGYYAPVNIHYLLWQIPPYNLVRAPGRFSLLFALGLAALAGFGVQAVLEAGPWRRRLLLGWVAAWVAGLWAGREVLRQAADEVARGSDRITEWVAYYLSLPRMVRMPPRTLTEDRILEGLRASLSPDNFWFQAGMAWLGLCLIAVAAALAVRRGRGIILGLLPAVIVAELLLAGRAFHPLMPATQLATASPLAVELERLARGGERVFTLPGAPTEPNTLLPLGLSDLSGYTSLVYARHLGFLAAAGWVEGPLLDAAAVRYVVRRGQFVPLPSAELTSYDPTRPLLSATAGGAAATAGFRVSPVFEAEEVRVISLLQNSLSVGQGTPVGEVVLLGPGGERAEFRLLAGVHTAEWAYDRADVQPVVKHSKPAVAARWKTVGFDANAYLAKFSLPRPFPVARIEVRSLSPGATFQVYGLGLVSYRRGQVYNVDPLSRERFNVVRRGDDGIILENTRALPRAFLVGQSVVLPPGSDVLGFMQGGPFDPARMVVFEAPDSPPDYLIDTLRLESPPNRDGTGAVRWVVDEPERVHLEVQTPSWSYLVLADSYYPGWVATVDGVPFRIYRANYIFRALRLPPGTHQVEFVYRPESFRWGFVVTLSTSAAVCLLLLELRLGLRRRLGPLRLAARQLLTRGQVKAG